jgi:phosphatidylserine decarboxylase
MVKTEKLIADPLLNRLYSGARENNSLLFKAVTSKRMSALLALFHYDLQRPVKNPGKDPRILSIGINLEETLDRPECLNTIRKVFERKLTYWLCRPMPDEESCVVSPADARMIAGSFDEHNALFLKEKFFSYEDLLSPNKNRWINAFAGGDFGIFRLTPDKYHYNHLPVSGKVVDIYTIDGQCHSCNPGAVVSMVTPFSKNHRVVTIIDTDVPGGTKVGLVAMIEIVAMMIGEIVQCYSAHAYDAPSNVIPGMFVKKGCPKSLYRPGSSVDVVIFQKNRVEISPDILANMQRKDVTSRFTLNFNRPLVETDVKVRSEIARRK